MPFTNNRAERDLRMSKVKLSFVMFGHPVVIYIIVYNIAFSVLGYVQDSLMSHRSSSMAMPLGYYF